MRLAEAPNPEESPLGQALTRVLLRRWYALLLPILVVPAAAFYLSSRQPAVYQAQTEILISRPEIGSLLLGVSLPTVDPIRTAETERELAGTRAVAVLAAARLGLSPQRVDSVASMLSVTANRQSDILTVSAKNGSQSESVRVANAAADAYTILHRRLETNSITKARAQTLSALQAAPRASQTASDLAARLRTLAALKDLAGAEAVVIQRAISAKRVAPQPARMAEFGLAIGLVFGLALAYLAEGLDRRFRSVADLGSSFGLPIVGELPTLDRFRGRRRLPIPMSDSPRSMGAEAFRHLETSVALSPVGAECRSVLVTSANRREGKTMTALNFALSAAEAGKRVLLIELDLRNPRIGEVVGKSHAPGATELVSGTATLDSVRIDVAVEPVPGMNARGSGLTIVLAGTEVPNPMPYLRSQNLRDFIREAYARFDLVVLDAPPLVGLGDAMATSALADGVLLVVDYRVAKRTHLDNLLDIVQQLPNPLIGIVVNRVPRRLTMPSQAHWRRPDEQARPRSVA